MRPPPEHDVPCRAELLEHPLELRQEMDGVLQGRDERRVVEDGFFAREELRPRLRQRIVLAPVGADLVELRRAERPEFSGRHGRCGVELLEFRAVGVVFHDDVVGGLVAGRRDELGINPAARRVIRHIDELPRDLLELRRVVARIDGRDVVAVVKRIVDEDGVGMERREINLAPVDDGDALRQAAALILPVAHRPVRILLGKRNRHDIGARRRVGRRCAPDALETVPHRGLVGEEDEGASGGGRERGERNTMGILFPMFGPQLRCLARKKDEMLRDWINRAMCSRCHCCQYRLPRRQTEDMPA